MKHHQQPAQQQQPAADAFGTAMRRLTGVAMDDTRHMIARTVVALA
jgi:hypothetical protein